MYTKEEREGILWEFRQSGLSVPEACRRLPLFPTRANLYRWLRMEEAGELAATEMPDRAARMHCAHGEGSARFAARSRRVRGEAEVESQEQTDWRDWGVDLPDDPAERARMAEVKLAEALAVHDPGAAAGPIVYEEAHYLEALEGKRWADGDIREAARANLELLDALGAGDAE